MKKKFNLNKSYLKFYILFATLSIVALLTPHIINGHIFVPRQYAESALLAIEMIIGYVFYILYRRDVERVQAENRQMEENLLNAYKHVGVINHKNEILGKFLEFLNKKDNYPTDKDIFYHLMQNIIVSAAKSNKGGLRFIDSKTSRTVKEYQFHKDGDQFVVRVSNKLLLSGKYNGSDGICVLESSIDKNEIKAFLCFDSRENVNRDYDFIKSLINQVYLVFLANYKKQLQVTLPVRHQR